MFAELVLWLQANRVDWAAIDATNQRVRELLRRADENDRAHAANKEWRKKQAIVAAEQDRKIAALKKELEELRAKKAAQQKK